MIESLLPPPEGTRRALIDAGIRLFGSQGFAATSIRQLATEAGANVAAIAYHFGGKDGLRLACAEEFGRRIGEAMVATQALPDPGPEEARQALKAFIRTMAAFVIGAKGAGDMVPFMLRELAEEGPGIDVLYRKFAEPTHRRLCWLWGRATGEDPESEMVRLTIFSLIGQLFYFRIGQRVVARRMGWAAVGPVEVDKISQSIVSTLDAMLEARGGS